MNARRVNQKPLRPQQAQFIDAYLMLGSVPEASDFVGVDRTTGWRWSQQEVVAEEIRTRTEEQVHQGRAALNRRQEAAWAAIDDLLESADEKLENKTSGSLPRPPTSSMRSN